VKYLFVHQNFPGQYLHYIRHLQQQKCHDIVFISEPNKNNLPGVRRVFYQFPKTERDEVHPNARDYDTAARRAEVVAQTAANLRHLGFNPDVIVGHHGWGELLNVPDIWPDAPLLGYFEFYYSIHGQDVGYDPEFPITSDRYPRIRAMNVVNLLALALDRHGQTPTRWQLTRYPAWAQQRITLMPEGARLDLCKPEPQARKQVLVIGNFRVEPHEKLVSFVARNLEPYRGFHTMMRALPELLGQRRDLKVVMVGGDDVSYGARLSSGTWREHMQRELAGKYDASRVLFPGQLSYDVYLKLLQRSDTHVYLTYPFVASWSLREALACGCAIVAADVESVAEFVSHGHNGLLTPGLNPKRLAETVLELLENAALNRKLRAGARRYAERHLDMDHHIAAFDAKISEMTGAPVPAPA
jgi:glycosyltransferase involved in cell wall biosynthesis